ncbi:GDP-L-fucose synthase [uncultured archaeon]|nr:GDP-L-fucose synthase [uncultured archaeon]
MKIYLTGGSGNLGKEVLRLIPGAIPLVRKPSGLKNEKAVDFAETAQLGGVLGDCGVLIHLAGSMKFHDPRAMNAGNVVMTRNLLSALPRNAKVVFASSISVYGKNISGKADEKTPPHPDSAYSKTKYEAEQMVMARRNSVALRIGPIYGPQYADYSKFLRMIKKGRMAIFGDGKNLVSFVHVSDVAKAVKAAINARPGVYIISGGSVQQEKIYEFAAKALHVRPPKIKIPLHVALLLAHAEEKLALLTGRKPLITREHINILGKSRVFDFSKAKRELGFKPRKLETGIKEIVKSAF